MECSSLSDGCASHHQGDRRVACSRVVNVRYGPLMERSGRRHRSLRSISAIWRVATKLSAPACREVAQGGAGHQSVIEHGEDPLMGSSRGAGDESIVVSTDRGSALGSVQGHNGGCGVRGRGTPCRRRWRCISSSRRSAGPRPRGIAALLPTVPALTGFRGTRIGIGRASLPGGPRLGRRGLSVAGRVTGLVEAPDLYGCDAWPGRQGVHDVANGVCAR